MKKLLGWLRWFDDHLIQILIIGYIFLIPLFPKLPIRIVNYTYIAFRFEDIYVSLIYLVFLIQVLRKKVKLNTKFFVLFGLFWLAVIASAYWGIFIQKNIIIKHLGFLHALRRVEYMSIFFVAMAAINKKKDFFTYMSFIVFVLFLVGIYALGQKFLGWPAVQTMNPEYAKGYLLFLTPEARVSSTFAGHYDLAAYLVFLMPIVWGFYLLRKNIYYLLVFILSLLILVFTASRISYIAYFLSTFPLLIFLRKPKYFAIALLFTLIFTFSSNNLTSRFKRTFQVKQIFVNQNTGQVVVPQKMTSKELPAGSFYVDLQNQPAGQPTTQTQELLKERILEQVKTEARNTGKTLTQKEEYDIVASIEARLKPINTIVSDISFATRLQVEWPRALRAFLKNPVLGTGPSSITEATDNDYLRSLGETGLTGSILFSLILFSIVRFILKFIPSINKNEVPLYYAFIFGLGGLLINAGYIDVFEASKVAYQFWLVAGLFVGSLSIKKKTAL